MTEAIFTHGLSKFYGRNQVLKNIEIKIKEGEFYVLIGRNGSGKSTFASILAAVTKPSSGTVKIFGKAPNEAKNLFSYMPQENFSCAKLTGLENLMYFAGMLKCKNRREITEALLKKNRNTRVC